MFTGIVEETGKVTKIKKIQEGKRLYIQTNLQLEQGRSISVDGACLTVEEAKEEGFETFLSRETLERTHFNSIEKGESVNLERALPAEGRFEGHIVQGHIDTTTMLTKIESDGDAWIYGFKLPQNYSKYIVEKGSIAIDGVSLTVASLSDNEFDISIIPETYKVTNFSDKKKGDNVNVEIDIIAKYIENLV